MELQNFQPHRPLRGGAVIAQEDRMSIKHFCICLLFATVVSLSLCYGDTNILVNPGFENADVNDSNWVGRSCTRTYTNEQQHSGSYSGKASGRTATWQGIKQSILGKLQDGNSCTISGWVRLENAASDTVKISIEKNINGTPSYDTVATVTANNTGWTYLSGNYTLSYTGTLTILDVYFEGPAVGINFYVDDVNVAVSEYVAPPPVDTSIKAQFCWTQRYNGSANKADYAQDIATDSAGNVYVTGYAKNTGTNYDFATIKYTPEGNTVWIRTYSHPNSYADFASAVTTDANSDIIIAGSSYLAATGFDGIIVKYTSAGNQLWANAYNHSGIADDIFYDVATDAGGNIYAVGERNGDGLIVKYAPDGTFGWGQTYDGSANDYDSFYRLAIDGSGNVYACGESTGTGTGQDCLIVKYLPDGTLAWDETYDGSANGYDLLEAIAVDSAGNAYVTGSVETATDSNYITKKYLPDGSSPWTAFYSGTDTGWDEAYDITFTSDGNVAVTGYSYGTTSADAATVKYNSQTGEQLWAARYNGDANSTDYGEAIAADTRGNIYVLGKCTEANTADYLLICYGADGAEFSAMNYNGPPNWDDKGVAIAVNGDEVYITGTISDSNSNYDYTTIKPYLTGMVDASTRHQVLEGFGAAGGWYQNYLFDHPLKTTLYDILFNQLGLDIYRIRNTYQTDSGYLSQSALIVTQARAQTDRPLKTMLAAWSPPAELKSNNDVRGGIYGLNATLAKNESGYYRYADYAQWWFDSLNAWTSEGVTADYVSMQNEPDYDASWESCRFDPTESSSIAGFDKAFAALADKIAAMSNPPKLIAPDTSGFTGASGHTLANYLINLYDLSPLYGYCHHLYNGGGDADNPDGFIPAMTTFATNFNDKPIFQTEFSKGDDVPLTFNDAMNLALLMHNSLAVEQAASYMYWELFWGAPSGISNKGLVGLSNSDYAIHPVYYAFKHFSAFTDPNWQRIEALVVDQNALRITAYTNPDSNQMSIVIVNPSNNFMTVDFNSLGGFDDISGGIYRTSETENCALVGQFIKGRLLFIPERSITTIALTGTAGPVDPCPNPPAGDLNGDCMVDFSDFVLMADNYSGDINDLKDIADTWLNCGLANQGDCWQ